MADIKQEHLTNADQLCTSTDGRYKVTGDGVFDDLMEAVYEHLDSQYKLNRLAGDKYADVYLGSMQSALAAAVQFVLGEQTADKQADLLTEQIEHEKLKMLQTKAQTELIKKQTEKLRYEMELLDYQTELTKAKVCTELAQACGPGPVDGTVLHAQMKLLEKQEESFDRTNEAKFLQVVLNAQAANSNVSGEPLCAVGAYQASGADSLIRSVGSNFGISVPGPSDSCEWEEASAQKKILAAQKLLREIADERKKLHLDDSTATP